METFIQAVDRVANEYTIDPSEIREAALHSLGYETVEEVEAIMFVSGEHVIARVESIGKTISEIEFSIWYQQQEQKRTAAAQVLAEDLVREIEFFEAIESGLMDDDEWETRSAGGDEGEVDVEKYAIDWPVPDARREEEKRLVAEMMRADSIGNALSIVEAIGFSERIDSDLMNDCDNSGS